MNSYFTPCKKHLLDCLLLKLYKLTFWIDMTLLSILGSQKSKSLLFVGGRSPVGVGGGLVGVMMIVGEWGGISKNQWTAHFAP